jgi:hypothetical protein
MVHKCERLDRSYIVVERYEGSTAVLKKHKPVLEIIPAPTDRRKAKALAKKLSGEIDDVSWIADCTKYLYKGGERRI